MLVGVSVAVIAAAFAVLVIYLIKTLLAAKASLEKTTQTLQEIQQTIDELGYEVKQVVRQASDITRDVRHKMEQIDPVMDSVKHLGEALSEITLAAKQASAAVIHKIKRKSESVPARRQSPLLAPANSEERMIESYASTYGRKGKQKKEPGWMKWGDLAVSVWQKFRHE
ncbi:DUF948 domain-containing protein [Paenibacillus sp. VCA1]|uniref:DUF948 domain-containing protein n=1 Tax=Paenibacillus sp. VCA1 TaxID=3039148 RepID=UPI002871F2D8|nr:DUF948 domain-containing protein [Paenibacillus sp. VCA1]MDR9857076.1 DUF948 domain-containing protein [Paenibacillus sp. VCA1]